MTSGTCKPKEHHSRRPRERSCQLDDGSSSCARFNPASPLVELLMGSLSIRRFAAATRSRGRTKSVTVHCRGSGRVRFLRGRFAALLARMSWLPGRHVPLRLPQPIHIFTHASRLCIKQPITAFRDAVKFKDFVAQNQCRYAIGVAIFGRLTRAGANPDKTMVFGKPDTAALSLRPHRPPTRPSRLLSVSGLVSVQSWD